MDSKRHLGTLGGELGWKGSMRPGWGTGVLEGGSPGPVGLSASKEQVRAERRSGR